MEAEGPRDVPVSERYALGAVLGQGTYGTVYRAFDTVRGRPVALKKLRRTTPHAICRFKTEFRAVEHLRHPNLVRLLELREEAEDWYLAMELVDGVHLLEWVRGAAEPAAAASLDEASLTGSGDAYPPPLGERGEPAPRFDEARLREGFRQLAQGIAALHAAGTLHRDLKPSNVLVTPDGRVVLLGFSLVTERVADEQSRVRGGTPRYVAPEHVTGAPLTTAADWYCLGRMLFEALTGLRPVSGMRFEVVEQKARVAPSSPAEHGVGLPSDLIALCAELLRVDPDTRPSGDEVLRRLGAVPSATTPARTRFVGRAAQIAALGAAMDRARRQPVVRIVDALSGMGKSALVHHFLRELPASHPSAVALAGRCYTREAARYRGLDSLVDALARQLKVLPTDVQEAVCPRRVHALVRLFPVMGSVPRFAARREPDLVDPGEERLRAFGALRELLARMRDRWPVVLFVDDVQWSDADSAALVAELFRPPDAPNLLLVLACRREDLSRAPMLGRLLELARDERAPLDIGFVHVDALTLDEARTLAAAIAGEHGGIERIVAEAKGSPFFVDQLARRARGMRPAVSLDALIGERVGELPKPACRLLEAVAVAGRPVSRVSAARVAHAEDPAGVLDALVAAHLVRPAGGGDAFETWHDRIQEAVVAGLSAETVRALHRRFAEVLQSEPEPDIEAIASHLLAAGNAREAGDWCMRAGDAAMAAFAFDRASRHYADALERGADAHLARVKRADALSAAGRGAEAAREQLAAAAHAPAATAQRLLGEAALQLLLQGHVDEGMDVLRGALGQIGLSLPKSPWSALFSVLWRRTLLRLRGLRYTRRSPDELPPLELARIDTLWAGSVGLATFDPLCSAELHARELLLALRAGEPLRMARAMSLEFLHVAVGGTGRAADTERLMAEAGVLAQEVGDLRIAVSYTLNRGIACFLMGRFAEARRWIEQADEAFRTCIRGNPWERDNLNRFYARVLICQGDLARLVRFTRDLVRDAEARGDATVSAHVRLRTVHLVRMLDDDAEDLLAELDGLLATASRPGFHFQHYVHLLSCAETELYLQKPDDAWNRVARTWPQVVRTMLLRVQVTRIEGAFLRGRCALAVLASLGREDGRREVFAGLARRERKRLVREDAPWGLALAAVLEAVHARVDGCGDAAERLAAVARRLDGCGMRLHAEAARLRAAEWAHRRDEGAEAWFAEQGVRAPARLARVLVPGV